MAHAHGVHASPGWMRIETERLILRPIDPERDFDAWARSMADPVAVRYIGGKVLDRAQAWRHMASIIGHWQIRGYGFFSVENRETSEWVGRVGPWYPEGWPEPEVGWTILPEHWGKGYATGKKRRRWDITLDPASFVGLSYFLASRGLLSPRRG